MTFICVIKIPETANITHSSEMLTYFLIYLMYCHTTKQKFQLNPVDSQTGK